MGCWRTVKGRGHHRFHHNLAPQSDVYVDHQPVTIASADDAGKLRGQALEIHQSELETLPEGQYYHFKLVGLEVWTTEAIEGLLDLNG